MKKSYQKRLDSLIGEDLVNRDLVSNDLDQVPEIEDLDNILGLPKTQKEIAFVKAACKAYKKSNSKKIHKSKSAKPSLEKWQETSSKSYSYNN